MNRTGLLLVAAGNERPFFWDVRPLRGLLVSSLPSRSGRISRLALRTSSCSVPRAALQGLRVQQRRSQMPAILLVLSIRCCLLVHRHFPAVAHQRCPLGRWRVAPVPPAGRLGWAGRGGRASWDPVPAPACHTQTAASSPEKAEPGSPLCLEAHVSSGCGELARVTASPASGRVLPRRCFRNVDVAPPHLSRHRTRCRSGTSFRG